MKLDELFRIDEPLVEGPHDPHTGKAIIMIGGPGSGKSYVVNEIIKGTGLKVVNSDIFYEYLAKKQDKPELLNVGTSPEKTELLNKASEMNNKAFDQYIRGNLGIILDGTGRDYDKTIKTYQKLRQLGYDVVVVAVNTDIETAMKRNQARERNVSEEFLKKTHKQINNNLGKFMGYFGDRFILVDNSEDSITNFHEVWKKIQQFINRSSPKHPLGDRK